MLVEDFIHSRQAEWQRLEQLVDRAGQQAALGPAEVDDLGRLYRQASADLALAQRDFGGQRVAIYLNQLVGRAHARLYRDKPLRWQQVRRFYTATFPQLYRQVLPYTIVAFLLFLVPALVAFGLVWQAPATIETVIGPEVADLAEQVKGGRLWTEIAPAVRSTAAASIMTNNLRVMFLTFSGGILVGLPTILVLVVNGLHIGGIFGLLQAYGMVPGLAEFVAAHGPIELSVIFLAGGCGLFMGDGLVRPGLSGRWLALIARGRIAVRLIIGSVPLLVIAGLIEGFLSPSAAPWPVKAVVGLTTGLLLHAYWLRAGGATAASAP